MGRLSKTSGLFHHYSAKDRKMAFDAMKKLEVDDLKDRPNLPIIRRTASKNN